MFLFKVIQFTGYDFGDLHQKEQEKTIVDLEENGQSYEYDVVGNLLKETTPIKTSYIYNDFNQMESV